MAFRDVVVRWLGERVARRIEQFVNGTIFGMDDVTCPMCGTLVPAALVVEREACPVCQQAADNQTMIQALEVEKRAAQSEGSEAINEAEGIERKLSTRRPKD
jgi:hypothetical protein